MLNWIYHMYFMHLRAGSCTSDLQLKVNCRKIFRLVCQLVSGDRASPNFILQFTFGLQFTWTWSGPKCTQYYQYSEIGFLQPEIRMAWMQVEQGFCSFFCQIYAIFDDFSKFHSTFGSLSCEKSSKRAKIQQQMQERLMLCSTCVWLFRNPDLENHLVHH